MGREGLREKDAHWLYGRYWLNMLRHKTPAHTYLLFISFNVSLSPFFFFFVSVSVEILLTFHVSFL